MSERKFTVHEVLFYWNENQKKGTISPLCLITSQPTDSGIFSTFVNLLFLKSFKQRKFYYILAWTREAKMNLFGEATVSLYAF